MNSSFYTVQNVFFEEKQPKCTSTFLHILQKTIFRKSCTHLNEICGDMALIDTPGKQTYTAGRAEEH